jgi:hypothetical protein
MQPYWAERDRQISYDQPQYLSASVTGYEDLNAYGGWANQGDYGQVWTPRAVPAGWEPYRNGHWAYMRPWGWTWVDEQPWGFAPFHYGRWVNVNSRWSWVPPGRETQAVYAPALVSFIGAAANLLLASSQPSVGWFPLGPREVYVPPYTTNRDYFRSINRANVRDQALIDARYQWAQQQEAQRQNDPRFTHVNQRFATVVPQQAFQQSQPVAPVAIKVAPEQLSAAPVAPVAAPPVAMRNPGPAARTPDGKPAENRANAAPSNGPVAHTAFANMETIGKPTDEEKRSAPGPKVVKRADTPAPSAKPETGPAKANEPPPLSPRTGAAPPPLKNEATATPAKPEPAAKPGQPAANETKGAPAPAEHPALVKPDESKTRPEPSKPPAGDRPEVPKPPPAAGKAAPPKPPATIERPEPPKPPAAENKAAPPAPRPPTAAERPAAETKAVPPPVAAPQRPAPAPEPPRPAAVAEPPHPAVAPPRSAPEPPHQAAAPPPQPQHNIAEQPHPAPPPAAAPKPPAPTPAPKPANEDKK